MWKSLINKASPLVFLAFTQGAGATGDFLSGRWLDNGGKASAMSPEFFWHVELHRMAAPFQAEERRIVPPETPSEPENDSAPLIRFTGEIDQREFAEAIRTKRINPPDPDRALAQNRASREQVAASRADAPAGDTLEEFASEFADYHRGARAFRQKHFEAAQAAWEELLRRPENERHYRTVWATFMLGKLALERKDPAAVTYFQQTRRLAQAGFADGLGLAADSYGWEARSELKQGHLEKAAQLYLTQLALGDKSAIVSLKALIPDRPSVEGMLNFGEQPPETATDAERLAWEKAREPEVQTQLETAASSPLLRRLVTAHILATETASGTWSYGTESSEENSPARSRGKRWLAVIERLPQEPLEDADHLGWIAYTAGRYEEAARWLKIADPASATSLWLQAKLERRAGKLDVAAKSMAAAWQLVRNDPANALTAENSGFKYLPTQSAAGDLAGLHLTRGEFLTAMEVFLQGNLWEDAAYLGDRVLTVDELKKCVDQHWPELPGEVKSDPSRTSTNTQIRWMLARRLVREDRPGEAHGYFPKEQRPALERYLAAIKTAEDSSHSKLQRARAYFEAGWIARFDGMELMGCEVEPDGFSTGGSFPPGDLDVERRDGIQLVEQFDSKTGKSWTEKKPLKLVIPATAEEKLRLGKSQPLPNKRFHYRHVAAGLAWKAAGLLGDGTPELADVLNSGGSWIKDRDKKAADRFFQALEQRCAKTEIGRAARTRHWFVPVLGPWSSTYTPAPER
jgi:hypothetical protein